MSEEEKKAIETLKEIASDDFDTLGDDISPKMAQNILNFIKKLQKEIEDLKEEQLKRSWVHIKENGEVEPLFYISKDKIRELIKNKAYKDSYNFKTISIEDLEELLEENNEKSDTL